MDLQTDSFDRRRQVFKNIWNKNVDQNLKAQFYKPKVIKTMKQSSGNVGNKSTKMMKYKERYKRLSSACNKILRLERKTGKNEFIETILGPHLSPKRKRRRKSKKRNVHEELYRNGLLKLREKSPPRYEDIHRYAVVEEIEKESITDLHGLEYYLHQQSQNSKSRPNSALSRSSFPKRKVIPPLCNTECTGFRPPSPKKKPLCNDRNRPNNAITLAMTRSLKTLRHPTKKELKYTYYTLKFPEI